MLASFDMRIALVVGICVLGLWSNSASAQQAETSRLPDIVLVTIDTLRADHLHCYGNDLIRTPAIDGLANDGLRFTHAFTPSPITNTSHVSILTGLLPSSHGVTDFATPLDASHSTLAQLLKEHGYHTAAFIGAVILDSNSLAPGLNRGFDFYDNFPQTPVAKSRWGRLERRGMDVVQHAKDWLDRNPSGPHFIWIHLYDPHDPYEPPPPFEQLYKSHPYDGEIAYADSALGNFLDYLKKREAYDPSLVILTGDHGEGLGEHGEDTHGTFLYDSTIHVPLIVKLPGNRSAGKTIDAQVRTVDIVPTVLQVLHVSAPDALDGASLLALSSGDNAPERPAFGQTDYPLHFGWSPLRSVRASNYKLIEAPRPELYDLHADPAESKNLYGNSGSSIPSVRLELAEMSRKASIPPIPAQDLLLPDPKDRIEEQNLLHAAMLAQEDSRVEDVRVVLKKVLQLDPKSWTALRQLGELELQTGNYKEAALHLRAARDLRPEDVAIAFQEGQALEKSGDLEGARAALETSLKADPGQYAGHVLLGKIDIGLKDMDAAEDQFDAALLLEPDGVEAQLGAAQTEIARGNLPDAAEQLQSLSKTYPSNPEIFELLAQVYQRTNKLNEATQAREKAKALRQEQNP